MLLPPKLKPCAFAQTFFYILVLLFPSLLWGQGLLDITKQDVLISGHFRHVYKNGTPGTTNYFHFNALTASNGWRITVVNDRNTNDWGVLQSDRTNLYMLATYRGEFKYKIYGYSFPGQFYTPEIQDTVHLFMPWMSFYFTPQSIRPSAETGKTEILWPWGNSLFAHAGYGYQWALTYFSGSETVSRIDVLRDSSLDLATPEAELRRSMADYPFAMSDREEVLNSLEFRKALTNGFNVASFEYEDIMQTNYFSIPLKTQFVQYWTKRDGASTVQQELSLEVDKMDFTKNTNISEIVLPQQALVSDYRYQMTNNRTKFNYATYILNEGDSFKSANDPVLLAQAKNWLKHGQRYEGYKFKRGAILAGMILVTLIFSGVIFFQLKRTDNFSRMQ
jgi:hypothetical protein